MDEKQAIRLGAYLRSRRQALRMGTHRLYRLSGVPQPTIVRLEQGQTKKPEADKLRRLAVALGLDPADILSLAGYPIPTDLLTPTTYLRAKYRDLPADQLRALQADVATVLRRHGIDPSGGPLPGEDEEPEKAEPSRT